MTAKYILAVLASLFLVAGVIRFVLDRALTTASRIWLFIALVFGAVSTWLWKGSAW